MLWMSVLVKKKTKTLRKTQNNLLKTKRISNIKISAKGAQFLHLACQGGSSPTCPRELHHWLLSLRNVWPWYVFDEPGALVVAFIRTKLKTTTDLMTHQTVQ